MIARDENVLRLDIAVNDSLRMRVAERVGDFAQDFHRFLRWKLALSCNEGAQILTDDEWHRVVEESALRAGGVKRDDMRVLEPCGELDLAAETICVESRCEIGREDFDHYLAVELGICRDEDARHASAAELAVDTVGRSEDFLELRLQARAQAAPAGGCARICIQARARPMTFRGRRSFVPPDLRGIFGLRASRILSGGVSS